tara:strand:- start:1 stop:147 length:147 start_codon:yes stop_codon:yes gene_type:complete
MVVEKAPLEGLFCKGFIFGDDFFEVAQKTEKISIIFTLFLIAEIFFFP